MAALLLFAFCPSLSSAKGCGVGAAPVQSVPIRPAVPVPMDGLPLQSDLEDRATLTAVEGEADKFAGAFLLPSNSFPNEVYTTRLDAFCPAQRALESIYSGYGVSMPRLGFDRRGPSIEPVSRSPSGVGAKKSR
jgi:hypothetical protein